MTPENSTDSENNTEIVLAPYSPEDDPEEEFAIYAEYGDDY